MRVAVRQTTMRNDTYSTYMWCAHERLYVGPSAEMKAYTNSVRILQAHGNVTRRILNRPSAPKPEPERSK